MLSIILIYIAEMNAAYVFTEFDTIEEQLNSTTLKLVLCLCSGDV